VTLVENVDVTNNDISHCHNSSSGSVDQLDAGCGPLCPYRVPFSSLKYRDL